MLFNRYGIFLQALALIHFARRRPDTFWLFVIIMGGSIGAAVYLLVEVIPDFGLLRTSFQVFPRRNRIKALEGLIVDNPSIGNYEELGDLLLDDAQFARARECFDKVIAKSESIDPFYRRALCAIALGDNAAASADLARVLARDAKYDYHRAAGLQARMFATLGERDKADALFREVTQVSTLSEVQYDYACFLAETGRAAEAREWAEKILRKKATMPEYIRRRERPWFRKAKALLKKLK